MAHTNALYIVYYAHQKWSMVTLGLAFPLHLILADLSVLLCRCCMHTYYAAISLVFYVVYIVA